MASRRSPEERAAAKRQEASKKAANTRARNRQTSSAAAARQEWETQNPQRFTPLSELHEQSLLNDSEFKANMERLGRDPVAEAANSRRVVEKIGTRQFYSAMGYSRADRKSTEASNNPMQGTLFDNPNTVDNPDLWEDRGDDKNEATRRTLAEFGVDEESARRAVGARLDKAMVSEGGAHGNFYSSEGESMTGAKMPRQVLRDAVAARGITMGHAAMANSQTSPESQFVGMTADGQVEYPNNESAMYSIDWAMHGRAAADAAKAAARRGASPEEIRHTLRETSTGPGLTGADYQFHPEFHVPRSEKVATKGGKLAKAKDDPRKYPVRGYPANNAKAVDSTRKLLGLAGEEPTTLKEAYGSAGQKVGPFHNAWAAPHDPEGNFAVLDTHASEGIAPHLPKEQQVALAGRVGVKAFNDWIVRTEMEKRGLTSVNRAQSAMWRSTKEDEGHASDVAELTPRRTPNVGQQMQRIVGEQELPFDDEKRR